MSRILVIGETCRDVFVYCDSNRLCPEAPVPVLNIADQRENPGMAGNVRRNIESLLGGTIDITTNKNWYEIAKTRYVHRESNHMFFRVDTTQSIPRINVKDIDFDYDLIVISDYNKGFLSEEDIEYICANHPNVFIDTSKRQIKIFNCTKIFKISPKYIPSTSFSKFKCFQMFQCL